MLRYLAILVMILASVFCAFGAEDQIIFVTNSSDYYFQLNTQANIPVYITNLFAEDIHGQLTYTITEKITQPGFQSTSSSTQSQPFSISKEFDSTPVGFNFGTSDKETTRTVSMSFTYAYEGIYKKIILPTINIHFVADPDQQQQSQQHQTQQQSQSEEQPQPQTSQDQMQRNIQNTQKSQDTNALKNQINRESQEQQETDQKLNQEIQKSEQYGQAKKELEEMGFKQDSEPQINSDQMKQEFTNPKTGEKANLSADIGVMKESLLNNQSPKPALDVKSDFQSKDLENQIMDDPSSINQELNQRIQELEKQGFNQTPMSFSNQNNQTTFTKTLKNPSSNETVTLRGELNETKVLEFEEKKENNRNILLSFLAILIILGYFAYRKFSSHKEKKDENVQKPIPKPVDHKAEALRMINEARKSFDKNRKDSYELLSYAVRYHYRHSLNVEKEITNKGLLKKLKNKKEFPDVKKILETSSIVEFAKGNAKKELFDESAIIAESLVKQTKLK